MIKRPVGRPALRTCQINVSLTRKEMKAFRKICREFQIKPSARLHWHLVRDIRRHDA